MQWFINGKIVDEGQANVPVKDIAILRGMGVFDFLITYDSKPFHLDKHLDRLYNSASIMGIDISYTKQELSQAVIDLIEKNGEPSVSIRIVVTGGVSESNLFADGPNTVAILIEKRTPYPAECYDVGIAVKTHEYMRFAPNAKHNNYIVASVEKRKATKDGFLEVLYVSGGNVYECTTSNIFIVKDNVLVTPEVDILKGITREVVLEVAAQDLQIQKREISVDELHDADEVFITASDKEIMPVIRIDDAPAGGGKKGSVTDTIMQSFRRYTDTYEA